MLASQNFLREHFDLDLLELVARREDDRAFDDIAQLADVAGPIICLQRGHGFIGDGRRTQALLGRITREEAVRERRNVVAPLCQRRHLHRDDVEPVEEILAEALLFHLIGQIARGGGNHAHVDADVARSSDADEALFGQDAQDPRLGRQRHVGDFVEIKRAPIGGFEQSGADQLAVRLLAEQFLLEPLGRDAR